MNVFEEIEKKTTGQKKGGREYTPEDLVIGHHLLMKWYGWISLEEFKNIPESTYFNLLEQCQKEEEKEHQKFRVLIKAITGKDIDKG